MHLYMSIYMYTYMQANLFSACLLHILDHPRVHIHCLGSQRETHRDTDTHAHTSSLRAFSPGASASAHSGHRDTHKNTQRRTQRHRHTCVHTSSLRASSTRASASTALASAANIAAAATAVASAAAASAMRVCVCVCV